MQFLIVLLSVCAAAWGSALPRLDGRIVGGQEVDIRDYPHQASVRIYDQHICGGTILDEYTVLTACHCVYGMDHGYYSVRVGNTAHAKGTQVRVSKVVENRSYNPNTINNDMAILKLASPINIDGVTTKAAELQGNGEEVASGTTAWVSGWGVTSSGSSVVPAKLRAVDVSVITNSQCSSKYPSGSISNVMMCAQTLDHDSCQGDSGGPLVGNGKLIGVVSWGYGCADARYPGVYAKVSAMRSWVDANRN